MTAPPSDDYVCNTCWVLVPAEHLDDHAAWHGEPEVVVQVRSHPVTARLAAEIRAVVRKVLADDRRQGRS